jgi:predicted DNA-binding antitoxin AbrB/MazE fold protein
MSLTVEVIYEDGVLKLTQPLNLAEGTRLAVVINQPETALAALPVEELDAETSEWLEADLIENALPYDWGEQGIPQGKKVYYSPEQGFVVEGGKSLG